MTGWTALIALHAAGATFALLVGAVVVLRPRKGDLLHRRLGRIWALDMYWVAFSSFGIRRLHPGHFSYLHLLSIWSIVSISIGIWAARAHRAELHRGFMVGTYVGLVVAGVAASAFPVRLVPRTAVHRPIELALALLGVAVVAATTVAATRRATPAHSTRICGDVPTAVAAPVRARLPLPATAAQGLPVALSPTENLAAGTLSSSWPSPGPGGTSAGTVRRRRSRAAPDASNGCLQTAG